MDKIRAEREIMRHIGILKTQEGWAVREFPPAQPPYSSRRTNRPEPKVLKVFKQWEEAEQYAESLRTTPEFRPRQACKPSAKTKRIGSGVM